MFSQVEAQPDSTDRVAAFVEGASSFASLHRQPSSQSEAATHPAKRFEFKVASEDREFLLAVFQLAKNRVKAHGFPLL